MCASVRAQVNSGSDGSDGAFNPTTNTVINMSDHPNGIYQYTSVNIPGGVTVTFIPNENNSPVTWLVQNSVVINGTVDVSGQNAVGAVAGSGGPGGWSGGSGGSNPSSGQGPGGGGINPGSGNVYAGTGAFGAQGRTSGVYHGLDGQVYGNIFLLPLLGGSGGGGSAYGCGGGGGGGAILIATRNSIELNGNIFGPGGSGGVVGGGGYYGGGGSGGGVRLVTSNIKGNGSISANSGGGIFYGGLGRVRIDTYVNNFSGIITGILTQGSQFVIGTVAVGLPQLTVTGVGGVAISAPSTGALSTPDAVLSAQQNNPIQVVVSCANLPLSTQITVSIKPANGAAISATGYNTTGTVASSTATISIVIPRGGGLIYATAATSN